MLIRGRVHVGLFVLLAGMYVLTGPGRIDIIDGQFRYDVTRNLVEQGSPVVTDGALPPTPIGRDGRRYFLGPAASLAGVPLVAVGQLVRPTWPPLHEFLFSFTSAFLAAGAGVLLFMLYELLGVTRRRAVAWTLAVAFGTMMWPLATSAFDQAQQACVVLLAVYAGLQAARRESVRFAALGGFAASVLVSYQEVYIAMVPALGLVCMTPFERLVGYLRSRRLRGYAVGFLVGLAALLLFNVYRFGAISAIAPHTGDVPLLGNPVIGALGLLVSPGKSMFLYSPPLLLAIVGWRALYAREATFARAVLLVVGVHFLIIACLAFWAGDWAWGPRYLVVTLPLVCLALPFVHLRRPIKISIVALGVVVQVLAISVDHQRYFLERGLADHFWTEPSHYFTDSALFARPGELASVLSHDGPIDARRFAPNPYRSATYTTYGNPPAQRADAPRWMQQYALFYTPRPWPLWMSRLTPGPNPLERPLLVAVFVLGFALAGAWLVVRGTRRGPPERCPTPPTDPGSGGPAR
ncbi:MAG: hypothetical protein M3680_19990 [Myxococcota bacterium]|nr:hypothetical protein [Myxococcota bacterium]